MNLAEFLTDDEPPTELELLCDPNLNGVTREMIKLIGKCPLWFGYYTKDEDELFEALKYRRQIEDESRGYTTTDLDGNVCRTADIANGELSIVAQDRYNFK